MDPYFKILNIPSLTRDVQNIFQEHILPHGMNNRNQILKNVRIDPNNPAHAQMMSITEKYPFLFIHLLIFQLPLGYVTPIHKDGLGDVDATRITSCNIPISGCGETCVTEFFEAPNEHFFSDVPNTTRFLFPDKPKEMVADYVLNNNVVLTNTQLPHRVNNKENDTERISVSWTIRKQWSWNDIAKLVDSGKYN
jgi:hypothetical protein